MKDQFQTESKQPKNNGMRDRMNDSYFIHVPAPEPKPPKSYDEFTQGVDHND